MAQKKGPNDDQRPEKKSSGSLANKWKAMGTGGNVAGARWEDCDSAAVLGLVACVTAQGGAITLGVTRDGGALAITVMDGDARFKEYIPSNTDLNEALWNITEQLQ